MICKITDFGAVADGVTMNTKAINDAVVVCHAAGGGYVDVPAGQYVTGTVELLSNVFLRMEPGSELMASKYFEDFTGTERGCSWGAASSALKNGRYVKGVNETNKANPTPALIKAENAENCGIIGFGTINGRRGGNYVGTENWDKAGNIFLCVFSNCRNVALRDVTIENPGFFNVYTLNCDGVDYDGVKIESRKCACGDGLDFDGSRNVRISNCKINAGDDAIGLKTLTPDEPCENFTITNCVLSSVWAAVRIGPETGSDFRNINISNCIFDKCNDGFKLQLCEDRVFEDFVFSNISMVNVMRPIFMTLNTYVMCRHNKSVRPEIGKMRRIRFENITARQIQKVEENQEGQLSGNFIYAMQGSFIEDVTLSDIYFTADGGVDAEDAKCAVRPELLADYTVKYPEALMNMGNYPSAVLYARNVKNLTLKNCAFACVSNDVRPAVTADGAVNLRMNECSCSNTAGLLKTASCVNVLLRDNSGRIMNASEEEIAKRDGYKAQAAEELGRYAQYAALADKAIVLCKNGEYDGSEKCTAQCRGTETYVVVPAASSPFEISVNGVKCASFASGTVLSESTCFAADVTGFVKKGSNEIVFCGADGEKLSGELAYVLFEK